MAQDLTTITANLKATYPTLSANVNGADVPLGQSAYDARIAEMADAELARQVAADDAATKKDLRGQVRLALTTLTNDIATLNGTPTAAQVRDCVKRTDIILKNLIQVLIDLRLVESS